MALIDGEINKAMEILNFISSDKEVQSLAEAREKALIDEISRINGAKKEGRLEGILEGRKVGVAKTLIKQLNSKFGELPEIHVKRIENSEEEVLDQITVDIFNIKTIEELNEYFK